MYGGPATGSEGTRREAIRRRSLRIYLPHDELSIARYHGTMTGPLVLPDGTEIPPTGKSFDVDFATVGHWKDGQMIEEYLFYDAATFMQQIGLSQ